MKSTAGIVVEVENEKAYVKISRNTACESCGACHFDEQTMNLKVTAINEANARVGDRVELSLENINYFKASIFLYGIPLLAMLGGIFSGLFIFSKLNIQSSDIYSIFLGLLFMAVSYLALRSNKEKFAANKNYMSVVTSVISRNELPVVHCTYDS